MLTFLEINDEAPREVLWVVREGIDYLREPQVFNELVLGAIESQSVEGREVLGQSIVHVETDRLYLQVSIIRRTMCRAMRFH